MVPLAGCGDNLEATLNGAYAQWTLSCSGGQITVNGQLTIPVWTAIASEFEESLRQAKLSESKTAVDGTPAPTSNFDWTHPGSIADVYLYEFDG